jgi:NADH-quinone oxidoreductase subunit H
MDWNFVLFSAIKIAGVFAVVLTMVAYAVLVERKVCAAIQDRLGPNRAALPIISAIPIVGPFLVRLGIFHPLADGLKLFLKEDFTPAHVRKIYFWLAPAITMIPALLTVAIIPFGSELGGQKMVIADLNVGVLYTFGIVSLGVYGIVLAGYAANSKYPFLGGIRSSAQMISYEIAMGLSVIPVFMLVGDLNLSRVIEYQAGLISWLPILPNWLIFQTPMTLLCFAIFIVAALAETNRMPFDFPEAEQELAGGYNVEYSSMKFGMFFMGEYANMVMSSALIVTLFLGGWTLPIFGLDHMASTLGGGLAHIAIFLAKLGVVLGLMIWVRWMFPRFRYDQLMDLGWRRFIPVALANILVTAVWLWMKSKTGTGSI